MNILVWNVQGLTDESKRLLQEHCRSFSPIIIGLIEPKLKMRKVRQNFWRSINMTPRHHNCRLPRRPNNWLLAQPSVVTTIIFSSDQVVVANCTWGSQNFRIAIVHGANDKVLHRQLWQDLMDFTYEKMVFIGDFNAIRGAHERVSIVAPDRSSYLDFCNFIDETDFIESHSTGVHMTWSGRRFLPRHIESRLDRALFFSDFATSWTEINTHVLPRITSNHSPLIFQCSSDIPLGRRSFKFLKMWLLHPGFHEVVANSWNIDMETRCPIYRVMSKLRRLRGELRTWNKDVFGHVDIQIADHQRHLSLVQNNISIMGYSDELFNEEVGAQAALNSVLARKHSLFQQKCRAHWLTDGERNTEFFHRLLRFRKNNLRMEHLRIGDTVSYDQNVIQQHIVDFFSNLFKDDLQHQVDVTMFEANIDNYVTGDHNAALIRIPDDEEIHAAVFSMDANSSPGPDGFSGAFFQNCWGTIKGDVLKAVKGFFINSYLSDGYNANILILILKKETVDTVADLRPIILSNFFFKIISKILATRLNKVAAEHVSPNQFGFIGGRSIHECIILGSKGFSCMNRTGRKSNMACKIDIRKAFDTMSWNFILKVLGVNGFHEKFVRWISIIFCSARISILYNGQLSGYFPCLHGVRQGDPLSPILFGIAEDVLSHILLNCVRFRHLIPMDFSRASHFSMHLFYDDDILIFCKASLKNARKIKEILDFYGGLSGQICSSQKSNVFFRKEVHSVIQSSVTHSMMVYKWPKLLIFALDRHCRNFIWTENVDQKPFYPVKWSRVCAPRGEGGLGVRSFSSMNRSFLMKSAWRLIDGNDFAFAVLRTRYLDNFSHAKWALASSPFWTSIRDLVDNMVENSFSFISTGASTLFWCDDW
ncbi:uncharacterized protein LOC131018732 [Salvia miltiorrhiza]|uniref:uncharacterized protein LOC131018732 n=1 Tax=Salvia miltiorrhiza TaxID=226208 RepID=UPI0025AD128E|nr:uncharacterized protein LOC131018732 [Salvia miltiorrhiza]